MILDVEEVRRLEVRVTLLRARLEARCLDRGLDLRALWTLLAGDDPPLEFGEPTL